MTCCMADRITVTLHELVSLIDTYAEGVLQRDHGMTFGEFRYLATLAELDGPDVTELARCMGLTKAAVSKRLPHLEGAGWVRRRADPAHGRRVILELTPEGATVVDLAGGHLDRDFTELLAAATESGLDLPRLHDDLRSVVELMRQRMPTGRA